MLKKPPVLPIYEQKATKKLFCFACSAERDPITIINMFLSVHLSLANFSMGVGCKKTL